MSHTFVSNSIGILLEHRELEPQLIMQIIWLLLRILIVLLIGSVSAVLGFIIVVNLGFVVAPEFTINGWEGYEATGPMGFILGALAGLIGSSMFLFRRQIKNDN